MIPGHMVAETLVCVVCLVLFMCFCSVLEKACLVCLDFGFSLICLGFFFQKTTQNTKKTETCKNTWKKKQNVNNTLQLSKIDTKYK
jgi:hypothetical protein